MDREVQDNEFVLIKPSACAISSDERMAGMGEVCSKDIIPLHGMSDMCNGHRTSAPPPPRSDYRARKSPAVKQDVRTSAGGREAERARVSPKFKLPEPSQTKANEAIRLKLSMPYKAATPTLPEEETEWENECKRLIDRTLTKDRKETDM
eukprot:755924-Hanusia_phi.AAC.3